MLREYLSSGFLTSSDTNRAVQTQKMAGGLKFGDLGSREIVLSMLRKKGADQLSGTAQLICAFFVAYAKAGSLVTRLN